MPRLFVALVVLCLSARASARDIEALQSQLSGHGWTSLATVRDRRARENVDLYIRLERQKVTGLVVLASEPRELTIVNVVTHSARIWDAMAHL